MPSLEELLRASAARHSHLCPRQVLGVRMGLCAGRQLNLDVPQTDKRLFAFMETDGCAADGVSVASGCWVGRRTMRVMDYGKVAATFVDTLTMRAIRIWPHPESRERAYLYMPDDAPDHWTGQLMAYQIMPDDQLLCVEPVQLTVSMEAIISKPGMRTICQHCGEEIMNEREVFCDGVTLCRACAGEAYYLPARTSIVSTTIKHHDVLEPH